MYPIKKKKKESERSQTNGSPPKILLQLGGVKPALEMAELIWSAHFGDIVIIGRGKVCWRLREGPSKDQFLHLRCSL